MHETKKILMKWAIESQDYYMAYILYTSFDTGIPTYLIYSFPDKKYFGSAQEFLGTSNDKNTNDKYLNELYILFKSSKYMKLPEWDNKYGYKYI